MTGRNKNVLYYYFTVWKKWLTSSSARLCKSISEVYLTFFSDWHVSVGLVHDNQSSRARDRNEQNTHW